MPKKKRKKKRDYFYRDMLFALALPLVMAVHFYGSRAISLCLVSVCSAVLSEFAGSKLTKQHAHINDCSSIYIGLLLALMLPASSPLWLPALGSIFAVLFIKTAFGSVRSTPFSCTAAAFSFLCICRPIETFAYPILKSEATVGIFSSKDFTGGVSVAQSLIQGKTYGVTAIELINTFIGSVPGPMGMTSAVVLLGALVYILFKRPKSFINAAAFIFTCFIGCVITVFLDLGTVFTQVALRMVCLRLFSGFTLCIGAFLITEEPLSPKKPLQRVFYGIIAGISYCILRKYSVFEDAGCFSVLATNAIWPVAEKYAFSVKSKKRSSEVIHSES